MNRGSVRRRTRPWPGRLDRSSDPVHVCADRCRVGVDVHLRRRRAGVAQAAVRSGQARPCAAAVGDHVRRRPGHALGGRRSPACCSRSGWRWRRSSARRTPTNPLPGVFYVLLWVGLVALSLAHRAGVARAVTGAHGAPVARPAVAAQRYPEALGYWPAALGLFAFVWLELASPDPGSLRRDTDLAADLPGRHAGGRVGVR